MLTYTVYQRLMAYSLTTCHSAIYVHIVQLWREKKNHLLSQYVHRRIIKGEKKKSISELRLSNL